MKLAERANLYKTLAAMPLNEKEEMLDNVWKAIYTKHDSHFTPLHPWVLVRVAPREHITKSGLFIPDVKSKTMPVHEGIVLETWQPFTTSKTEWRSSGGDAVDIVTLHKSDFKPGDHVVYPHFAGLPVPGWDEKYYRIVPERTREHKGIAWNGIIMGTLDYPQQSVIERLSELTYSAMDARKILEEFDVIKKPAGSKLAPISVDINQVS